MILLRLHEANGLIVDAVERLAKILKGGRVFVDVVLFFRHASADQPSSQSSQESAKE